MSILRCPCPAPEGSPAAYQEKLYGRDQRVHVESKKAGDACTCCGNRKTPKPSGSSEKATPKPSGSSEKAAKKKK